MYLQKLIGRKNVLKKLAFTLKVNGENDRIRIREAQKAMDPVDPDSDLQHCSKVKTFRPTLLSV